MRWCFVGGDSVAKKDPFVPWITIPCFLSLSRRRYQPRAGWAFPKRRDERRAAPAEHESAPGVVVAGLPIGALHFIAPPSVRGGRLHLAWPEAARGRTGKWRDFFAWSVFAWSGRQGTLYFFQKYISVVFSPSVSETSWCWKWERQFPPS